jgi:hypothetical protein
MKSLKNLTLFALTLAAIGTTAAMADDQQLQNRLALERMQNTASAPRTTVALYANDRGTGRAEANVADTQTEARFEFRTNAHGERFGVWVNK